jgi:hypothetical protein
MGQYRQLWRVFAAAVATLGIALALVTRPLATPLAIGAVSLGMSFCVALGLRVGVDDVPEPVRATVRRTLRGAALATVCLTTLVGLASLGVGTVLFVGLAVAATSPQALERIGATADGSDEIGPDSLADEQWRFWPSTDAVPSQPTISSIADLTSANVSMMDTSKLALDWQRSFVALERCRDPRLRMALVEARQAFLDELERRDPSGLHNWLESGARAAGDPTKFMTSDDERRDGGPHAA